MRHFLKTKDGLEIVLSLGRILFGIYWVHIFDSLSVSISGYMTLLNISHSLSKPQENADSFKDNFSNFKALEFCDKSQFSQSVSVKKSQDFSRK